MNKGRQEGNAGEDEDTATGDELWLCSYCISGRLAYSLWLNLMTCWRRREKHRYIFIFMSHFFLIKVKISVQDRGRTRMNGLFLY